MQIPNIVIKNYAKFIGIVLDIDFNKGAFIAGCEVATLPGVQWG